MGASRGMDDGGHEQRGGMAAGASRGGTAALTLVDGPATTLTGAATEW